MTHKKTFFTTSYDTFRDWKQTIPSSVVSIYLTALGTYGCGSEHFIPNTLKYSLKSLNRATVQNINWFHLLLFQIEYDSNGNISYF